ncbi:DUF3168 domain-containing protein [Methyloceanibacter sp.]|uniref:DUF3168 domain-containing protein n=1 Tax=Methyloceanibacter sp. TaxID=1965321 RepID=UPI0035641B38
MTAACWALQRSMYQTLSNASELTSLLGGDGIYSNPPPAAEFPFITIGQTVDLDWSTGTEDGNEHSITLHIWSRADSAMEVHEITEVVRNLLHDQALTLDDHELVNLRHEFSQARIDPDGETLHGIVRYRAVTEPMQQAA